MPIRQNKILLLLTLLGICFPSLTLASTSVLPEKINSPSFRYGTVSGIGQRYNSQGSLMTLTDLNSLDMNSAALVSLEPEAKELVSVLNNFGPQGFGDNLHLGSLKIEVDPSVKYFAPIYARGMTDKWTLAVGLPVITYQNNINLYTTGSNIEQTETELRGISPDLDAAFDRLKINLVTEAQNVLQKKGYKPLENREDTFLGDVQLASLYQFMNRGAWSGLTRTTVNLPTGPAPDPDDLTDLDIFHQTSIDQQVVFGYNHRDRVFLYAKSGVRLNLPDQITTRVPEKVGDLPDVDRRDQVQRQIGPQGVVGAATEYRVIDTFSVLAGLDFIEKMQDSYKGSKNWDYSVLAKDTRSSGKRARLGVALDTTRAYFRNEAMIPALVSYEWTDTLSGRNIERQTTNEIWLTLFF